MTNIVSLAGPLDSDFKPFGERISSPQVNAAVSCAQALSLDDKLRAAQATAGVHNNQQIRSLVTQLLKENFKPLLEDLRNALVALTDEEIQNALKMLKISEVENPNFIEPNATFLGFNAQYTSHLSIVGGGGFGDGVGATAENNRIMRAAALTAAVVFETLKKLKSQQGNSHPSSKSTHLLEQATYLANPWETLRDSLQSYILALSQLTSSSVPGFTDLELVERLLTRPANARISIMSLVAILYGPAIIGPHGQSYYFANPLSIDGNGQLSLSAEYKAFLKNTKPIPADRTIEQTGNGCPVAHCSSGEQSGIDILSEGFLSVYRRVFAHLENGSVSKVRSTEHELNAHLLEQSITVGQQTVFYRGQDQDGYIYLSKLPRYPWKSFYAFFPNSFTTQGDPRSPILFFGAELSRLLGFDIYSREGEIYLKAPSAQVLLNKLSAANKHLAPADRVVYLPKQAGFLDSAEAIDFSLSAPADFLFAFPYADSDELLVVHEIGYHLGAIIYPNKFFLRARAINRHIKNFISYLQSQADRLSSGVVQKIIEQILRDRMTEIDVGTANPQALLAHYRRVNQLRPYNELIAPAQPSEGNRTQMAGHVRITNQDATKILNAIDLLAQPSYTPLQALVLRLSYLTGQKIGTFLTDNQQMNYEIYKHPDMGLGQKVALSQQDQAVMRDIVLEFVANHSAQDLGAGYEIANSALWYRELFATLDERIQKLTQALSHIRPF